MKESTRMLWLGVGAGVAAAASFPFVLPIVTAAARPLAKAILKQSLLGADRLRTATAHASEALEDLFAEVRAEVENELEEKRTLAAAAPNVSGMTQAPETAQGNGGRAKPSKGSS